MDCKTSLSILALSIWFQKNAKQILNSSADY